MEWFIKASAGAIVVVIVSLFARSKNFYIAGLVPLFPTFTLIAHYTVGIARTPLELKETVLFSMWGVIPYFLYLLVMYTLADKVKMETALTAGIGVWLAAAGVLIMVWNKTA
ncbi:MAG: hypothetical protein EBV03_08155 [Proteobacteria bacterium]|nr:hypothetical protein [Pseudomonadota bacterium]